ncbi:HTH-type transcriptional regulator AcrR [Agrobacterium fabrum]|jgi:TetR/AcrR family transcriptional regulator, transcriptional repressor for nem operon|uniref:Transcriptional regulator, TetR family n=2 Tax=Agrobacterium fabrum TaxID=1176649 RepID=A0A7Z7BKW2_9HYPH|nr:TetR/AcrR family transcriptional regulator [Agrobacterium fabrum]CAH0261604.1 HTH-type transcriptional regulator AcrR [Agrobacterium fabrum]CAH0271393.1 HTH-type transcriptional regulator AcrR [Agrobacterium fabrum]SDJ48537.1 transcriptional regulator, TetR family [Agrobacterium fabrum]
MFKNIFTARDFHMPYSRQHTSRTRQRILDSAVLLFSRHGYDGVTLDELMQEAGLTRGAFYAHFTSKQNVYVEAMRHAATHGPMAALNEQTGEQSLKDMIRGYLDMGHVRQDGPLCLLAFLVTDITNQQPEIRDIYKQIFEDLISRVTKLKMTEEPDTVLALTALMIGGVAVARALNDDELSTRVLNSSYRISERLISENL